MNAHEAQRYARVAGFLIVVSLVAGSFGESYVPGKLIVGHDAAETARRLAASIGLFRVGFGSYLVEAACDLTLTAIFYALLRPVSRPLSLIALCFGVFSTATFAVGEVFYFAAGLPVIDTDVARALSPEVRVSFTYLCFTMYGYVFAIFTAFYGVAMMLRGYLIFRSSYFPRTLGALLLLGGAGFVLKNTAAVLAPQYDSMVFVPPMLVAMLSTAVWFLVKGLNGGQWEQMAVRSSKSQQ
jgi:Domain of unknown function (DUF4386)